jgi:hypothetical protein
MCDAKYIAYFVHFFFLRTRNVSKERQRRTCAWAVDHMRPSGNYFQVVRSQVWAPGHTLLPGAVVTSSCNLGTMINLRIARVAWSNSLDLRDRNQRLDLWAFGVSEALSRSTVSKQWGPMNEAKR